MLYSLQPKIATGSNLLAKFNIREANDSFCSARACRAIASAAADRPDKRSVDVRVGPWLIKKILRSCLTKEGENYIPYAAKFKNSASLRALCEII